MKLTIAVEEANSERLYTVESPVIPRVGEVLWLDFVHGNEKITVITDSRERKVESIKGNGFRVTDISYSFASPGVLDEVYVSTRIG